MNELLKANEALNILWQKELENMNYDKANDILKIKQLLLNTYK